MFWSPLNLHYSQTLPLFACEYIEFWSPLNLHYSQTCACQMLHYISFGVLWIYTTLKTVRKIWSPVCSFGVLWIYTTLKLMRSVISLKGSFGVLWIYTTLKRSVYVSSSDKSFGVLWIYTTLKQGSGEQIPHILFWSPLNLHYSQTSNSLYTNHSRKQYYDTVVKNPEHLYTKHFQIIHKSLSTITLLTLLILPYSLLSINNT